MVSESSTRTSNGLLSFLGIAVVLFAVTVVAVGALALTGLGGETLEQKRATARIAVRMRLEKEAQEKLTTEGWADKAKGLVHVTIADAIPLVVAELRSKKPAPSQVKVEPPLPIVSPLLPSQGADMIRFTPPGTPAPAPVPGAPAPAATAPAVPAAPASAPAPAPAAPVPKAAPAPAPVPAPAPAPQAKPVAPAAAPASAPEPPARPPLINPTENPAPTK